jgi:hypothetical protein
MEGKTLSGGEFNRIHKGKVFVKLTNEEEKHDGFQFQTGLNEDQVFNSNEWCSSGGIYFCEYEEMAKWLHYDRSNNMVYYRNASIPSDSIVYIENGKYKANKVVLEKRIKINEETYIAALKHHGLSLKYVNEQTKNICMAAVENRGLELQYVGNQTDEICMAAVQQNGFALYYVKNQTEEICMAAVQQNCSAINYVKNRTKSICMAAVQKYNRRV